VIFIFVIVAFVDLQRRKGSERQGMLRPDEVKLSREK
jgi:hypothetical protein